MSLSSLLFEISIGALKVLIESLREDVSNVVSSDAARRLDLAEAVLTIREKVPGCSVEQICHQLADELRSRPSFSVMVPTDVQGTSDQRDIAWDTSVSCFSPKV